MSGSNINYLSAAYPFNVLNRNMIVSVNYQYLYDFNRHWEFPLTISEPDLVEGRMSTSTRREVFLLSVLLCIQMTPRISFGFTLNFWQDGLSDNKWKMETHQSILGTDAGLEYSADTKFTDEYVFSGFTPTWAFCGTSIAISLSALY